MRYPHEIEAILRQAATLTGIALCLVVAILCIPWKEKR